MRTLILSMFGTWGDFVRSDYRLAKYLLASGYEVDVLYCDGDLDECDIKLRYRNHGLTDKEICGMCTSRKKLHNSIKGVNFISIGEVMKLISMRGSLNRKEAASIRHVKRLKGMSLNTMSTDLRLSIRYIDGGGKQNSEVQAIRSGMNKSSYLIKITTTFLLIKRTYDCGIVTHPHRTLCSAFDSAFEAQGKDCFYYQNCFADDYYAISERKDSFPIRQELDNLKLTDRKKILNGYSEVKRPTDEDILYLLRKVASEEEILKTDEAISEEARAHDKYKPEFEADMTNESLEYIKESARVYKTVILVAMSTESEEKSTTAAASDGLDRQILDSLLEGIGLREDTLLIIREHPNRYSSKKYPLPERSYWHDRVEVEKQINSNSRNVIYIDAWSKINTSRLLKEVDCVIAPTSTIAADAKLTGCYVVTGSYSRCQELADYIITRQEMKTLSTGCELLNKITKKVDIYFSSLNPTVRAKNTYDILRDYYTVYYPWHLYDRKNFSIKGSDGSLNISTVVSGYLNRQKQNQTLTEYISHKMLEERGMQREIEEENKGSKLREKAYELLKQLNDKRGSRMGGKEARLENNLSMTCLHMVISGSIKMEELFGNNIFYHAQGVARYLVRNSNTLSGIGVDIALKSAARPVVTDIAVIGSDSLIMRTWEESRDIEKLSKKLQRSLDWCDIRAYIAILLMSRGWSAEDYTISSPITSENIRREVFSLQYVAEPASMIYTSDKEMLFPMKTIDYG